MVKQQLNWDKRDQKAKGIISLHLKDSLLPLVMNANTAKDTWSCLQSRFEVKQTQNIIFLKRRYRDLKMGENGSIQSLLNDHSEIVACLKAVDVDVSEQEQVWEILLSLPTSWEQMVQNLAMHESLTLPDLQSLLLLEEQRRNQGKLATSSSTDVALAVNFHHGNQHNGNRNGKRSYSNKRQSGNNYANQNSHGSSTGGDGTSYSRSTGSKQRNLRGNLAKVICRRCNGQGHIQKDCPSRYLEGEESPEKKAKVERALCVKSFKVGFTDDWYIDSGCCAHMTWNYSNFTTFKAYDENEVKHVVMGNGHPEQVIGEGSCRWRNPNGSEITLNKVLFIPTLRQNLISVQVITTSQKKVIFENNSCSIVDVDGVILLRGIQQTSSQFNAVGRIVTQNDCLVARNDNLDLWHRRLCHLNVETIQKMDRENISGFPSITNLNSKSLCTSCIVGKQQRGRFGNHSESGRVKAPLELIHSDVCGPMEQLSISGMLYYGVFIDDFSRYCEIVFMRKKSDIFSKFCDFRNKWENQLKRKIQKFRTDNGKEYCNEQFNQYLNQYGIIHETTAPYTPEQNGVSERKNRVLEEAIR